MYRSTLLALATTALAAPQHRHSKQEYDFIVVGGGTSGLVVANRLSEDPNTSVAILEAGGSVYNNTNVTSLSGYGLAFGTEIDFAYQSEPQIYTGNKSQTLRAAKALGGTSTINGMVYMRAEESQINSWAEIGSNVTWDSLLPYYRKSEQLEIPTAAQAADGASFDTEAHGLTGPLKIGWPKQMVSSNFSGGVLNSTFGKLDMPFNADPNAGDMRGWNVYPWTADSEAGIREDAARAYYWPSKFSGRPNLHLYLNAFAERMTWDNSSSKPKVNGVVYRDANGQQQHLSVKKDVVLSAGSLRSPLILEHSGIGNPDILSKFGIETKVNQPFVGESLQDQMNHGIEYNATASFSGSGGFIGYFNAQDIFGNDTDRISKEVKESIPAYAKKISAYSKNVVDAAVLEELFKVQHKVIFEDLAVISEIIVGAPSNGASSFEHWGLMPFSRGNIHISSANASAAASIQPNYFMLDWDVKQAVGTSKKAREIASTAPLKNLLAAETTPGLATVPANATDSVWEDWIKSVYRSNFHYISTAAMMPERLGGVVDSNHLVYGTVNVRIVDASVLPFQVSGHLVSTLYAVAEMAADKIKASHA